MWKQWRCWSGETGKSKGFGICGGYVGVLLWVFGVKYVFSYRGGARKMNVLAKVMTTCKGNKGLAKIKIGCISIRG